MKLEARDLSRVVHDRLTKPWNLRNFIMIVAGEIGDRLTKPLANSCDRLQQVTIRLQEIAQYVGGES